MIDLPAGPALSPEETTFRWLAQPYGLLDECAAALGDTFTLRFTRFGTHVVVAHPDDVHDVLTADREALHAGRGNALLSPILGASSLLVIDGDRHLAQRTRLQPPFRRARIAEGTVGLQDMALEISKEVILRAVIGLEPDEVGRVSRLVHDLMLVVGTNATIDPAADGSRVLERLRSTRRALDAAVQEQIDRRRSGASARDDVLSILLAAGLPDDEIRDQLVTIVIAGHETTASSIAWAILCLHAAPDALEL